MKNKILKAISLELNVLNAFMTSLMKEIQSY